MRFCDWLSGADEKWISEGFKTSFFYKYYFGEKTAYQIERDFTLKDNSKCLHWDPIQNAFIVSVKKQKIWKHLPLKTKTICFDVLEKEAKECYKKDIQWETSTMFDCVKFFIPSLSSSCGPTKPRIPTVIYVH